MRGRRPDLPTSPEREAFKHCREAYELRRGNEILKVASAFSRPSSTKTGRHGAFIDEHRARFGPSRSANLGYVGVRLLPARDECALRAPA